jgi:hypothetical protein
MIFNLQALKWAMGRKTTSQVGVGHKFRNLSDLEGDEWVNHPG